MIVALLLAAAAQPSPDFARDCRARAKTTAEQSFCAAGERALKEGDSEENACLDRDQSQQGMNRCAGDAFERADKALNAMWSKVLARYGEEAKSKKLLLDSQRTWLKYRDTYCELAAYDNIGGSIWPLINSGCLAAATRQRTRELADLIEGEGQ